MSSGTTSGLVESSCPNLTKVGPSSSSISRSRRPRSDGRSSSVVRRRRSTMYPKPCRVATLPISDRRPIVRCFGCAGTSSVWHAQATSAPARLLALLGLEQAQAVLELGDAERQVVDLVALHEP